MNRTEVTWVIIMLAGVAVNSTIGHGEWIVLGAVAQSLAKLEAYR